MIKSFFQWIVRIALAILVSLPITGFLVGNENEYATTTSFFIITFFVILLIHLISKMRIFVSISPFSRYIIVLISLALILFFFFVIFVFFTDFKISGGCSACEKSQERDYCYYKCAYFKDGGFVFCEKINSVDWKNKCYAWVSVKTNEFFCDKISGGDEDLLSQDKTVCYQHFAVKNKDISFCEKLSLKSGGFHLPRYSCYRQVAVALQDPSVCEKIPNIYPIPGEEKNTALINNLKNIKSACLILKK